CERDEYSHKPPIDGIGNNRSLPRRRNFSPTLWRVTVWTIGHGTRPAEELVEMLAAAGVRTLVDVRRFPGSRRNPQYKRPALERGLAATGIPYRHAAAPGGGHPGHTREARFYCLPQRAT